MNQVTLKNVRCTKEDLQNDFENFGKCIISDDSSNGSYTANSGIEYCTGYPWDWWYKYYWPVYYPVVSTIQYSEDKGKKALSIAKMLIEKKFAKVEKIKDFCDLIDEIVKLI